MFSSQAEDIVRDIVSLTLTDERRKIAIYLWQVISQKTPFTLITGTAQKMKLSSKDFFISADLVTFTILKKSGIENFIFV